MRASSMLGLLVLLLVGPVAAADPADALPEGAVARLGTTRLRTGKAVEFLAFSPDGRQLASWTDGSHSGCDLTLWDTATGREQRRAPQGILSMRAFAWLPDGHGAAVVLSDVANETSYHLWDYTDEKPLAVPPRGGGPRVAPPRPALFDVCFAVAADGRTLFIGRGESKRHDDRVVARALTPGQNVGDLKVTREFGLRTDNLESILVSPDGTTLVAVGRPPESDDRKGDRRAIVWDVAGDKERCHFAIPKPMTQGYRPVLAASDRYLVVGLEDEAGTVRLYDLATGKERILEAGHKQLKPMRGFGVSAVAFTPSGETLLTAGRDGVIRLWEAATGKPIRSLTGHHTWIEALAVSRDGTRLASAGQDGVIRLWDLATGADACPQPGHATGVWSVAVSPDGRTAVTTGLDGSFVWDVATTTVERRVVPEFAVYTGAFAPDGRTVLLGRPDGPFRAYDAATGKEAKLPGALGDTKGVHVAVSSDGRTLITMLEDKVALWDWPSGALRREVVLPPPSNKPGISDCTAATLSPDGRWLATASYRSWYREERGMRFGFASDGVIDLFDATTGKHRQRLVNVRGTQSTVLFAASGELVVAAAGDVLRPDGSAAVTLTGDVNLIDPLTLTWRRAFARPTKGAPGFNTVTGLKTSADGRVLYVARANGAIAAYEIASGGIRQEWVGHRGHVAGLAVAGDRVFTSSLDATALVWDASLSAATVRPATPPDGPRRTELWGELSSAEAGLAYRAMAALATTSAEAVALVREKLPPVKDGPDDATIDRLVADLDSPTFATREKAMAALDRFGDVIVPGLRARLADAKSQEVRQRLVRLLGKLDPATPTGDRLRELRALELLERLGTPDAQKVLQEWASGTPQARRTREAAEALKRMK